LMSDCSMTSEMQALVDAFGWGLADMQWLTINAMKSAFIPFDERLRIINGIKANYATMMGV
jgi:adenosine deaminase